ncbi:MAG: DNA repair exonuclease [Deltaproteobacteria bacterium]|nr:DNA repair exonuclease [Deltaproteobacteria bacterium]
MFKFIHAADIHLDSPLHKLDYYEGAPADEIRQATRRAFDNLVQTAIAEDVDFILIAGDLYDGDWKDYNTGLYLVSQTGKLRDAGISVYIAYGNHDAASKITKTLRLPENVYLFPSDKPSTYLIDNIDSLNVAVHGQSFAAPAVKKDLSLLYPPPLTGYFNIGVLHTCASGREGHAPYSPCTPKGLSQKGYDYWALGHVHQQEILCEDPPILFSGNIQGRHIRETGPKGCMLITVDESGRSKLEFKPLDVIRWAILKVDSKGVESGYDLIDRFCKELEILLDHSAGRPLVARVLIEGETPAHSELLTDFDRWSNEIRAAALDIGGERVWIEKIKIRTKLPPSEQDIQAGDGAIGELVKLFDELASQPELLRGLSNELIDLDKKIPKELKKELQENPDGIGLDDIEWLGSLVEQVRPMLIRMLIRKGDLNEDS